MRIQTVLKSKSSLSNKSNTNLKKIDSRKLKTLFNIVEERFKKLLNFDVRAV